MAGLRLYRETVKIPISVTWHQELVDDGPGGKDFYMRITPHINLGGKKGVPLLEKKKGAYWQKTELQHAIINAKLKSLMEKVEKDLAGDAKEIAVKSIRKGQQAPRQALPTKDTTISDTHEQALERSRRQHGISLEDQKVGEEERKRQQESGKKVSADEQVAELQKTYNTEEDAEMMRQLLGKSTSGYNAIIQDLNNTKVGLDDDDYDY